MPLAPHRPNAAAPTCVTAPLLLRGRPRDPGDSGTAVRDRATAAGAAVRRDAGSYGPLPGLSGRGESASPHRDGHPEKAGGGRLRAVGRPAGHRQGGDRLHGAREREVAERRRDIGTVFRRFRPLPPHDRPG